MKGFGVLAIILTIWIILSYIIIGITSIPFVNFGVIEHYAKLTVKYIVFFVLNLVLFIILSFIPVHKREIGIIIVLEIIFGYLSVVY